MFPTHPGSSKDFLCDCLERYLSESGVRYARRMNNRQKGTTFNVILDSPGEELIEQSILIYVHDSMLYLDATVCVNCSDRIDLAALVNTLNDRYAVGSFQYNPLKGNLCFAHYVAARDGIWPGNEAVGEALALAQRMSAVLYHETRESPDSTTNR